ncbi:MAG: SusC/RagA family TonB-linked outer membrane protein [Bacteroidales bacterium]|nr:SusC/RagA family TonB-linked outer membrane protein [Bacteroidales bacterium]
MKRLITIITTMLLLLPSVAYGQSDSSMVYLNSPLMFIPGAQATGAVDSVDGETLQKFPVAGLQHTLPGMLSGLAVMTSQWEPSKVTSSSGLSSTNVTMVLRGKSTNHGYQHLLMVIDGMICPSSNWVYISPNEIESITVLKDAASASIYGIQGASGVICITTKKGFDGKMRIDARFDQSVQQMTRRPDMIHSWEYAAMRNQAAVNDGLARYSQFSAEAIENYRNGSSELYPDNDWYKMYVRPLTTLTRTSLNVSGGNAKVKYFTDLNYMHQQSPIRSAHDPARDYDPSGHYNWFGMRSNVDMNINSWLSAWLRLSANVQLEKRSRYAASALYAEVLNMPPTVYGPLTPFIDDENDPAYESGNQVVGTDAERTPVYGMINRSGYGKDLYTTVTAQSGLRADLSDFVKGLGAGVDFNYQTYAKRGLHTYQNYETWIQTSPDALNFTQLGSTENTPLVYGRASTFYYHMDIGGQLSYDRRFGEFTVNSKAYLLYQRKELEATSGSAALPYKRETLGATASFGYRNRYFLKADVAYAGSEQFAPEHRYLATPGISAAWIATNEEFLKGVRFLDYLKVRASYGHTANDIISSSRFLYLDYVTYSGAEGLRGNPNLSAEVIKGLNLGFDARLFGGLSASFDWFSHRCDNMLISSAESVPIYQGVSLDYYPYTNSGVMENHGYELSLSYGRTLESGLSFELGGNLGYAHNTVVKNGEAEYGDDYAYKHHGEGYSSGQLWGLKIDRSNGSGFYNFASEITAKGNTYGFGTPRVGDLIYQDLTGDHVVDDRDLAPLGHTNIPEYCYGIFGNFSYKRLEFSFLFEGLAKYSAFISGAGVYETSLDGIYSSWHKDAWTPERWNNGESISYPALSLASGTNHRASEFFLRDLSHIRLKNVELAYTLPEKLTRGIGNVRVCLSGQNLFTIDRLGLDFLDPESTDVTEFKPFRVYNLGISLTF